MILDQQCVNAKNKADAKAGDAQVLFEFFRHFILQFQFLVIIEGDKSECKNVVTAVKNI
jgi:hypothetical protein